MAIVLRAEFDKEFEVFTISVKMGGNPVCYEEMMTVESFKQFCEGIDRGFVIGRCRISFGPGRHPEVSKRTERGIIDYFRSAWRSYELRDTI